MAPAGTGMAGGMLATEAGFGLAAGGSEDLLNVVPDILGADVLVPDVTTLDVSVLVDGGVRETSARLGGTVVGDFEVAGYCGGNVVVVGVGVAAGILVALASNAGSGKAPDNPATSMPTMAVATIPRTIAQLLFIKAVSFA